MALGSSIMLTYSGNATGILGATAFTNAAFTVTSFADTASVTIMGGPTYEIAATSSTIAIAGLGTAGFSDSTFWSDPQGSGDIIFNDAVTNQALLGFVELFAGLETYQFTTSIGPVSSGFAFVPNLFPTFQNIPTSLGLLTINSTSNELFSASVLATPEPALGLSVAGLFAALLLRRLRRSMQTCKLY